ncbi:MAG TPA: hypothetical protein VFC82_08960 [Actinomycetaceae bacterium]|nr:hypothetical protein [Actinomycetaceae bacterium]
MRIVGTNASGSPDTYLERVGDAQQVELEALLPVLAELGLEASRYFPVSARREENVDPVRLGALLDRLEALVDERHLPMLASTHPRMRKRLEALELETGSIVMTGPMVNVLWAGLRGAEHKGDSRGTAT